MIQWLLPRPVALVFKQQLSSIIWGKSDSFKAVGNLSPIYDKEAVKMVANKTVFSHEVFAWWEMSFLCLVRLPCSWRGWSKGFFPVTLFVNP